MRIVWWVAQVLVGVYAGGVAFAVLAPSVMNLPGEAYVRLWQAQNHDYGRVMPVLLLSGIALLLVAAVLSWRHDRAAAVCALVAALLLVATVALTVTQLEPLNEIADSWNPDQLPADWARTRETWWSWHLVRTAIALVAFAVLLAGSTWAGTSSPGRERPSTGDPARSAQEVR